jgi:hypothetical protein
MNGQDNAPGKAMSDFNSMISSQNNWYEESLSFQGKMKEISAQYDNRLATYSIHYPEEVKEAIKGGYDNNMISRSILFTLSSYRFNDMEEMVDFTSLFGEGPDNYIRWATRRHARANAIDEDSYFRNYGNTMIHDISTGDNLASRSLSCEHLMKGILNTAP